MKEISSSGWYVYCFYWSDNDGTWIESIGGSDTKSGGCRVNNKDLVNSEIKLKPVRNQSTTIITTKITQKNPNFTAFP